MRKNPKVILLGDTNVGKTSIVQVLIHGTFQSKMANTLGACFHRYQCQDGRGEPLVMDIWDTAGQERFRSLLTMYYKNSDAVVIVFDVTDANSFKTVDYWTRQIEMNCQIMPVIILVANKIDLRESGKGVSKEEVSRYLEKRKKWLYAECSAKDNLNVKSIFKMVSSSVRDQQKQKQKNAQNAKMKIHPSRLRKSRESSSCC